jgi:hypothetical protein
VENAHEQDVTALHQLELANKRQATKIKALEGAMVRFGMIQCGFVLVWFCFSVVLVQFERWVEIWNRHQHGILKWHSNYMKAWRPHFCKVCVMYAPAAPLLGGHTTTTTTTSSS